MATPKPMKCGAELTNGTKCDEFAVVTGIQYIYDRVPEADDSQAYDLKEIHYRAVCPKCGDRTLIETP
jgi:hypothetical protein